MAKKQIDGDGLDIPNRIKALPVKRTGPIVAAVIVALLAAMLLQGLITNPRFEWNVVWKYLFNENVLEGIKYTLLLTVISMGIAIILAVILAVMRKSINPVLRGVSWFYIWFFRGTPVYTQLVFWGLFAVLVPRIGVGIPFTSIEFWSIDSQSVITAFNAAWLGLALNEAAYLAEIVRAGLEAVDPGQTEAAKALGMKRSMIMRRVVLPQAMRIIIPPTGNEFIGMLKTTSLVNAVPFTLELRPVYHRRPSLRQRCGRWHRYLRPCCRPARPGAGADRGLHLVLGDHLHSDGAAISPGEAFRQGLRCATGRRARQAAAAAGQNRRRTERRYRQAERGNVRGHDRVRGVSND